MVSLLEAYLGGMKKTYGIKIQYNLTCSKYRLEVRISFEPVVPELRMRDFRNVC